MGTKDMLSAEYLDSNERFADLINGVIYSGLKVVKPEELREQDKEFLLLQEHDQRKVICDKAKLWRGVYFTVFIVENQTHVDYHMIFRNMLTESLAYDKQWKHIREKHQINQDLTGSDEFLSGMKKTDCFTPVITLVLYFGTDKPWDGATTLHELLALKPDNVISNYISNYRLNLFDYHNYDHFEQFKTELQTVFEFLRYSKEKEKLAKVMNQNHDRYEELSREAKSLLAEMTHIHMTKEYSEEEIKEGNFNMCKAFDDMKEEGRIEGRTEAKINFFSLLLSDYGTIPEAIQKKIIREDNKNTLSVWLKAAAKATSMEEFISQM